MTLRIRAVRLRAETNGPTCGLDIQFGSGLNIIRADNSSGKSTSLQAIIYALGLEGMLSARREVPLPHVMTDSIEVNGAEFQVQKSYVQLEIENQSGEILTVERGVKGAGDTALIKVWSDALLTGPGTESSPFKGYFVRRQGAAQREVGFHFQLARFLGWNLPRVTRNDGSEGILYLECLFPYFYVEQKHGWTGIQARMPAYLGIRDVGRRTVEFILNLEAYDRILLRQRLESVAAEIQGAWRASSIALQGVAENASIVIQAPAKPLVTADFTPIIANVPVRSGWISLDDRITSLRATLAELVSAAIPEVRQSTIQASHRLVEIQDELSLLNGMVQGASEALEIQMARRGDLDNRIDTLTRDLQKHKDSQVLQRLGAPSVAILEENRCPTCEQAISDAFEITDHPMSIDDSVNHIEQQLRSFRSMHGDTAEVVSAQRARVHSLQDEAARLRTEARHLKETLVSPGDTPSIADIARRVRIEDQISVLERVALGVSSANNDLLMLAERWQENKARLESLGAEMVADSDAEKIAYLRSSFVSQLTQYGFRSLLPSSIDISLESYRPTHEGFDLGFDLSASDMIRVIWAYLMGALETSIQYRASHANLLIFDEPRQQETNQLSFAALLRRAAEVGLRGAQVIFATSAESADLEAMLEGLPHEMIDFAPNSKLLRPV